MARSRPRSPSPDIVKAKKSKFSHLVAEDHLTPGLLLHSNVESLRSTYVSNTPYKYAIIEKLFREDLLKQAKDECLEQLHFTEKETDIYKVRTRLSIFSSGQISLTRGCIILSG
jgi:prolyl 3-hydroxylase /prolyl 3,4-dihydroxylase